MNNTINSTEKISIHAHVSRERRENRKQQKTSTNAFTTAQYVSGK